MVLKEEIRVSILDKILVNRGLKTKTQKQRFLNPDYNELYDGSFLPDINKAINRINQAIKNQEKVVIYGDYDIDGICSVAMLIDFLGVLKNKADYYIPDRFNDGYGLNEDSLKSIKVKYNPDLIIAVDCGTNSVKETEYLVNKKIDLLVIDHHEQIIANSRVHALVNPKIKGSRYPFRQLSTTGIVFKLIKHIQNKHRYLSKGHEKWFLDLAAMGTICDQVPLIDENRIIAHWGLKVLSKTRRQGIRSLANISGCDLKDIDSWQVGFVLGPRLNASGRIDNAKQSLKLLISNNKNEADEIAQKLEIKNQARRTKQHQIEQEALSRMDNYKNDPVLVLSDPNWSHGIIGIVASRLMEKYQKPVFIAQEVGTIAKGSARSFGDFSAVDAINESKELLLTGGGHQLAAGFSLKIDNFTQFKMALNNFYKSLNLKDQSHLLDQIAELSFKDLKLVNLELADLLSKLEPYGNGNPKPLFKFENLKINNFKQVGVGLDHLKISLVDVFNNQIDGIAFNNQTNIKLNNKVVITGFMEKNSFNGKTKPQINIKTIKIIGVEC